MKLRIPSNDSAPFRKAWAACLRSAPRGARIASLPELAAARVTAPAPHAPGKVWETYYDGTSPLWERWIMTSTCVLLGLHDGEPTVLVGHGVAPPQSEDVRGAQDEAYFSFSQEAWTSLLAQSPVSQRMSVAQAKSYCEWTVESASLTSTMMKDNAFLRIAFGASLDPYAEAHRAIASEYLANALNYIGELDRQLATHKSIIVDPPIIDLNHDLNRLWSTPPPARGALGRYFCLENLINMHLQEFRHGLTRSSGLSLASPTDDAKFLVVVD